MNFKRSSIITGAVWGRSRQDLLVQYSLAGDAQGFHILSKEGSCRKSNRQVSLLKNAILRYPQHRVSGAG